MGGIRIHPASDQSQLVPTYDNNSLRSGQLVTRQPPCARNGQSQAA
jgi:hypothetical protein